MKGLKKESTIVWDAEVDVVVMGAGAAGLAAAIEAADAGAETMLFEKQPTMLECSSALCSGMLSFAGTDLQGKMGIEDSSAKYFQDIMDAGQWKNDAKLVKAYVDNQLDTYNWLQKLGLKWGAVDGLAGMSSPRGHAFDAVELVRLLTQKARERGVSILYAAPVRELLTNGRRRVTGVRVEETSGMSRVKARKGVVMATGGFSRDLERLTSIDTRYVTMTVICSGKGTTGDGHKMAKALGAYERDIEYVKPSYGMHAIGTSSSEISTMYAFGAIIVNKRGERYVNESISYKEIAQATLDQPDGIGFQIFDRKLFDEAVKRTEERRGVLPPEIVLEGLDKGRINLLTKGNTIGELASAMGVVPEVLEKTVDRYNGFVDCGKDSEYGRAAGTGSLGTIVSIETPPFYAYESRDFWPGTYAGIAVDEDLHVITPDGKIQRLYAAGELIGGFHGAGYVSGTAIGKAVILGRIAGRNAAEGL